MMNKILKNNVSLSQAGNKYVSDWKGQLAFNTLEMSHETWISYRKVGVGGSDSGSIMGVNKYADEFSVWLDKTNRSEPLVANEAMLWGNILEEPVAAQFAKVTGKKIAKVNRMIFHENEIMFANIDRRVVGEDAILEVKTAGLRSAHLWGAAGTDEVPDSYLIQVQHYLAVTKYAKAYVACLIGGQELRIYEIDRDDNIIEAIEAQCVEFWDAVESDNPPCKPSDPQSAGILYKKDNGEFAIDSEASSLVDDIKGVQEQLKALQGKEKALKADLCSRIGDATGIKGSEDEKPLATWKSQTRNSLDTKQLKADHPELAEKYAKKSESRVLRIR